MNQSFFCQNYLPAYITAKYRYFLSLLQAWLTHKDMRNAEETILLVTRPPLTYTNKKGCLKSLRQPVFYPHQKKIIENLPLLNFAN